MSFLLQFFDLIGRVEDQIYSVQWSDRSNRGRTNLHRTHSHTHQEPQRQKSAYWECRTDDGIAQLNSLAFGQLLVAT
ncbi:hypothetical protein NIES4106_26200 [Fischerella sp. NIES-4106]|jgi:hypothetical protein|nr:hypothetical protein NIES4106_26200 [Fischerella sp. NIES-4106]